MSHPPIRRPGTGQASPRPRPARPPLPCVLAVLLLAAGAAGAQVFSDPLASTNPNAPFEPGAVKVYLGKEEGAKITVVDDFEAATRTFAFAGQVVECHVLREVEFEDGELTEISVNYFAEDDDGNVWYFGETVDEYEDGEVEGHGGSWLVGGPTLPTDPAGTANAPAPALFMPFDPQVGDTWKPEDLFPLVDETVELLDDEAKVKTPYGTFDDADMVEETSQLPDSMPERKWYVAGPGFVKARAKHEKLALVASTLPPVEEDDED